MINENELQLFTPTREDRLFDLYCACLGGWHSNVGGNDLKTTELSKRALDAAESALKVWEDRHGRK